jgi:2',3'-cyclic-nucleotide 2'-phosphodiesterase (5'-nucleotidase family)
VKTPEGQQFGGARAWMVREIGGLKVGFFGVITPESRKYIRGTTAVTFEDYIAAAARSVGALRKAGADIVVALTHMNMAEDRTLIRRVRGIHLVLGGHEHIPLTEMEGRTLILKAGSDAAYLGVVRLDVSRDSRGRVRVLPDWRLRPVRGVAPDPAVKAVVDRYNGQLDRELGLPIGVTRTPLDSRAEVVRSREASMGNLIADAMRAATKADIALMNGGGIRGNKTYPAGTQLTRKDILGEMPFNNRIVVLKITGKQLRAVLEYGLSRLGPGEGRFPQVSGLRLAYDAGRPPGDRITALTVGGKPVQPAASYSLATNDFLAGGGDGYVLLKGLQVLVNDQNGPALTESVIAYIRDHGVAAATVDGRIKAK